MRTLPIGTVIDPLGLEIMGGFAQERDSTEDRYNKAHDKLGKFASTDGLAVDEGYVAGKWARRNGREAMAARIEENLKEDISDRIQKKFEEVDGPNWARKMAEEMSADAENVTEYRNGPHLVSFRTNKVNDAQQKQFLKDFDTFETHYPTGNRMELSIVPSGEIGGAAVGGETHLSTGRMRLNERIFVRDDQGIKWHGMPVSQRDGVTSSRYVLAHEWGHTHYEGGHNVSDIHRDPSYKVEMSPYGQTDPMEAHAEAFAEWSLTKSGTSNPVAQAYAEEFGWGDRWLS